MSESEYIPSRENILDSFAVEEVLDASVLKRYQRRFPEFAYELLTLYHELQDELKDDGIDTPEDIAYVQAALQRHLDARAAKESPNLFANWSVAEQKEVANLLQVPKPVVTAFRDHLVDISTVPEFFLQRFAAAMKRPLAQLRAYFATPLTHHPVMQHKAAGQPVPSQPVSFEQLLKDVGLSEAERARLLSEEP